MKGAILRAENYRENLTVGCLCSLKILQIKRYESTTALEILNDFPEGLDYIVTGVGTGGHISGVASVLKEVEKSESNCSRACRLSGNQRR